MTKVILDMAVSLDNSIGIPNDYRLHNWYFSSADPLNKMVVKELEENTGAIILGRRSYDVADVVDGWMDNPYKVPHFVITHNIPAKPAKGDTEFTFVTDGVGSALAQAKAVAGDKPVIIGGGADIAQQFLKAGLLDEIQLHLVPILFGGGSPLFANFGTEPLELEQTKVIQAEGVTHISYRVVK
jgi:dihydrofolate reductase